MSVSAISPTTTVTRPRASLAVAMLGFFVVALDAQIVNVALPEIRNDLGGGLSGLQWIVTGYTLMFSALQLFSGTFSDRAGARRAYGLGMILFTAASAACAFSPSLPALIAGRILQGIGAARSRPARWRSSGRRTTTRPSAAGPSCTGAWVAQSRRRPVRCLAGSSPRSTGG